MDVQGNCKKDNAIIHAMYWPTRLLVTVFRLAFFFFLLLEKIVRRLVWGTNGQNQVEHFVQETELRIE